MFLPSRERGKANFLMRTFSSFIVCALILTIVVAGDLRSHAQMPEPATRGVIRLKVRYKTGDATKELPRKRFFLIKGSLAENRALIDAMTAHEPMSRGCYYRRPSAS